MNNVHLKLVPASQAQYANASHGLVDHFMASLKRYFERAGPGNFSTAPRSARRSGG